MSERPRPATPPPPRPAALAPPPCPHIHTPRAGPRNPSGFAFFFLLRTAPKDHQPPTANRQPPPTANRHQPPTATNRQPPFNNASVVFCVARVLTRKRRASP